jgi:MFS family permease
MFNEFFGLPQRLSQLSGSVRETFAAFRNRDFRIYSVGQLVSLTGTWMQSIALSWMVYQMTGSALTLGIVSFASTVPVLLLSFFAGAVADRYDRKRIIMIAQCIEMLQAATLAVLVITNQLTVPLVIILAVLLGLCSAFEMPARQTFVPALVKDSEMANAIGLNSALLNGARMFGPALAGVVIGLFGASTCFILNAVSYLVAFISLYFISAGSKKPIENKKPVPQTAQRLWQILKESEAVDILYLTAAISIFGFQFNVLMPAIVGSLLLGDAQQLGLITAGMGVGSLVGSLLIASRGSRINIKRWLGFGLLGLTAAIATIGWSHSFAVSLAAAAVAGFCFAFHFGGSNYTIQMSIPEEVRGRVMGIYTFFVVGLAPFGALMAGWLASNFGLTPTISLSALGCGVAAMIYLRRVKANPPVKPSQPKG